MASESDSILRKAVLDVVRNIHEKEYEGIVVSGRSQAISYSWFHAAWENLYGRRHPPRFFEIAREDNEYLYAYDKLDDDICRHLRILTRAEVESHFRQKYPEFWGAKDQRLCYLDDVAFSGVKHQATVKTFKGWGYGQMGFALFCAARKDYLMPGTIVGIISPELAISVYVLAKGIGGTSTRIYDLRSEDEIVRESGLEIQRMTKNIEGRK
ncbi:MAG: hypothetical protein V1659_02605 [Candidatus Woesearchaeota archaeon]